MSKQPVSIHITHDGNHQLEIQCAGNPFGILYCLARAAAKSSSSAAASTTRSPEYRHSHSRRWNFDGGGSKQ